MTSSAIQPFTIQATQQKFDMTKIEPELERQRFFTNIGSNQSTTKRLKNLDEVLSAYEKLYSQEKEKLKNAKIDVVIKNENLDQQ